MSVNILSLFFNNANLWKLLTRQCCLTRISSSSQVRRQNALLLDVVTLKVRKFVGSSALFLLCYELPLRDLLQPSNYSQCKKFPVMYIPVLFDRSLVYLFFPKAF